MTTSMKTPQIETTPLAPVIQISEQRAVRNVERKTGRKVSPDHALDTMRVAMLEGMDVTPKQKKAIVIGAVALAIAMPFFDSGKKVIGSVFENVTANIVAEKGSIYSTEELAAIPEDFHVKVEGHYGIGHIEVLEEAGEQGVNFSNEQVEHDVADYIDSQLQHNNPRYIDVPNVEAYEDSLEVKKPSNNG